MGCFSSLGKHSPASSPACGRFIIPTYIRWGVLRKKPPYPSYAVREDIRKLDQRIEQAEFIFSIMWRTVANWPASGSKRRMKSPCC